MTTNPILSSTAVWHGRRLVQDAVSDLHLRGHDNLRNALDAYAAAILAEVRRRVEALDGHGRKPDEAKVYVLRAAVLALLDGRDA